jgi:hypothetical protein
MDEHIAVSSGEISKVDLDIVDDNLNSITWWTDKHNSYASREAVDLLNLKYRFLEEEGAQDQLIDSSAMRKRLIKDRLYSRLPLGVRAAGYFVYRYFVRMGFLDGIRGTIFHLLQGFWYRLLVDVKVLEVELAFAKSSKPMKEVIRDRLNLIV